jgi:two-component system sensor histidine kinase BaeS
VVLLIVYLAIQYLAADYLMTLMEMYGISPADTHGMFLTAINNALGWAAIASLSAAVALSWFLTRRVLKPLAQMVHNTSEISAGDYDTCIDGRSNGSGDQTSVWVLRSPLTPRLPALLQLRVL